jgi:AcrR family transcriptional regulator
VPSPPAAPTVSAPPSALGARARVRAELTREITDVARARVAADGAAALSLRAVARDLGMASSAVYRYFPSRDALLTALIIEAYDALGDAVDEADARTARRHAHNYSLRVRTVFRTVRTWALANPHEWALIYGSPVPGYAAPQDTIGPATRVSTVLLSLLVEGGAAGNHGEQPGPSAPGSALSPLIPEALGAQGVAALPGGLDALATAVVVRAAVFGVISFELNGQHHQVVEDDAAFFEGALDVLLAPLGQAAPR